MPCLFQHLNAHNNCNRKLHVDYGRLSELKIFVCTENIHLKSSDVFYCLHTGMSRA